MIQFLLCVLAYRCLIGTAPSYLAAAGKVTAGITRMRSPLIHALVVAACALIASWDSVYGQQAMSF